MTDDLSDLHDCICRDCGGSMDELRAENERLRAALRNIVDLESERCPGYMSAVERVATTALAGEGGRDG